jgi:dolichol-phosphate mannosyltransferase
MTDQTAQKLFDDTPSTNNKSKPHDSASSPHSCLVIVPTYNEALNIEKLIVEILAQGPEFDVLVVDDHSPDGTGDLVAVLAAQLPRVALLRRPGKFGLGSAYREGFRVGLRQGYHFLCEMDADFSHQPGYLPTLLAAVEGDADVALGSRYIAGGAVENCSWARQLISQAGSLYARMILGMPIADCTGGFKCFRADVLRQIRVESLDANGYGFQIEMNYRCYKSGLRIVELPIIVPNRVAGTSKMSQEIIREAALMVWRLRFSQNTWNESPVAHQRHA